MCPVDADLHHSDGLEAYGSAQASRHLVAPQRRSREGRPGCLIAACTLRADVAILHCDRDFPAVALIAPLREREG